MKERPSIEFLHECFRYEDGKLFWKQRPLKHFASTRGHKMFHTTFAGKEAGCLHTDTHNHQSWVITFTSFGLIKRHQIVWAMHKREWVHQIDHKNTDSLNDRIENLRPATGTQNQGNRKKNKNNTSGFKGVSTVGSRWRAEIGINGVSYFLGMFDTPEEAHAAYCKVAQEHFGEFFNSGERG